MTTSPVMSITDELLAELEVGAPAYAESCTLPGPMLAALLAHIADLKQQIVAAGVTAENCEVFRKDAERYQWLRENWFSIYGTNCHELGIVIEIGVRWNHAGTPEHVDSAIDAAMEAAQ